MGNKGINNTSGVTVYETSESGHSLKKVEKFTTSEKKIVIRLLPEEKFQTITGFGGSFTEASASLLNRLSKQNRKKSWRRILVKREPIIH
jgi:glucosylceramidase